MLRRGLAVLLMALVLPITAQAGQTIPGDNVEINYSNQGTWNWRVPRDGFRFRDLTTDPWTEFTWWGTPWQYISVEFDDPSGPQVHQAWEGGSTFTAIVRERNDSVGTTNVSFYQYAAGPLDILKREVWDDAARVVYIEFVVTNTAISPVTDFRLMHAVDPDQAAPGNYQTFNDVVDGDGDGADEWVQSAYPDTALTMGYGLCDPSDEIGHTTWDDDADATLADDDGASGDRQMHWRHRETSIGPRATVTFGFIVAVDVADADAYAEYATAVSTYCGGCDGDGDTSLSPRCGGTDCDDTDPTIFPGATELCDGIDNDCDSTTADGSGETWIGALCDGPDTDLCEEGTSGCVSGARACSDTTGDDLDLCDDVDNDCDSTTPDGADEVWFGAACDGPDSDLCEEGTEDCVSTARVCSDTTGDDVDICDDMDNDCDSSTPEGSAETWFGTACDGPDSDLCEEGTYVCVSSAQTCNDDTGDSVEICNGADDDCDGETDEGGVCDSDDTPDSSTDAETDTPTDGTVSDADDDMPGDVPTDIPTDIPTDTHLDSYYDVTGDTDETDAETDTGDGDDGRVSTGCGCEVVGGSGPSSLLLALSLALALLGLRRRQR